MPPRVSNEGLSAARPSSVVWGLMNSSSSRMVWPRKSRTGTTECAKYPAARAALARRCDSSAKASTSARRKPPGAAIRSAPMLWGTNSGARMGSGAGVRPERKDLGGGAEQAVERGDQIDADALGHEQRGQVGLGVLRPGAALRAQPHPPPPFHPPPPHPPP